MCSVALLVLFGLLGDVENVPLFHEFLSLLVALSIGVGLRRVMPLEEMLVERASELFAEPRGLLGEIRRTGGVLGRLAFAQDDAREFGAEIGGGGAPSSPAAGTDLDVARKRPVVRGERPGGDRADLGELGRPRL